MSIITTLWRKRPKIAGFLRVSSKSKISQKRLNVKKIGDNFKLSDDELKDITNRMSLAIQKCRITLPSSKISRRTASLSSVKTVKCWDTCVKFPLTDMSLAVSRFLSLELTHGVHFLTRLTYVSDTNNVLCWTATHPLQPECLLAYSSRMLFDRLANHLAKFTDQHGVRMAGLPLSVTFGFPIQQSTLKSAVLYQWTKGFDCKDAVGRDVVHDLRLSFHRSSLKVGPVVVFNDACVLIINSVAEEPATRVSLVVDYGCNCCFTEARISSHRMTPLGIINNVVNTEWGAFGDDGVLSSYMTKFDKFVDAESRHPGMQIFEKMTSGKFMHIELYGDFL